MKTKIIIIIIAVTILIIATVIELLHKPTTLGRQAITAIPVNSSAILKVNGVHQLLSLLSENNFFEKFDKENPDNRVSNIKTAIDSICRENSQIDKILNDSSVYISLHDNNKAPFGILIYLTVGTKNLNQALLNGILDFFYKQGYQFKKINEEKTFAKTNKSKKLKGPFMFYYIENGLLVIGNNSKNIAKSFEQFDNNKSLTADTSFLKVFNSTGKNVDGSLFINLQQLPNLLSSLVKPAYMGEIKKILNSRGWAALDFNIEKNYFSLHGFSNNIDKKPIWIKTLRNEQPVENFIFKSLPASTAFYGAFEFKDPYNYKTVLNGTVVKDNRLNANLKILRQSFGCKIDENLLNILDHSVALDICFTKENAFDIYCIVRTKNILEARNFLVSLQNKNPEKTKRNHKKPLPTEPGQETLFINLPAKNIPIVLFGQAFNCGKYPAACNYKQFIVFGGSIESLHSYLEEINDKNISDDSLFRNVSNELLASKANLTLYLNIQKLSGFINNYITHDNFKTLDNLFLNKNTNSIFGLQVSGNGQFFYNNFFLYNQILAK